MPSGAKVQNIGHLLLFSGIALWVTGKYVLKG